MVKYRFVIFRENEHFNFTPIKLATTCHYIIIIMSFFIIVMSYLADRNGSVTNWIINTHDTSQYIIDLHVYTNAYIIMYVFWLYVKQLYWKGRRRYWYVENWGHGFKFFTIIIDQKKYSIYTNIIQEKKPLQISI